MMFGEKFELLTIMCSWGGGPRLMKEMKYENKLKVG